MLLRWEMRFVLWFWFLWRVSKLNLHLVSTHPDRAGGLGFLARSTHAFVPIMVAESISLTGVIAEQILHAGQNVMNFRMQIAVFLVVSVAIILSPLTVFTPVLSRVKRQGLRDYGTLSGQYVEGFEEKWVHGGAPAGETLVGSADIQSLADLANSYAVVEETRLVPFGSKDVTRLAVTAAAPLLPLALTRFSAQEVIGYVLKALF